MTIGLRLNNPGNIRVTAAHWLGKITPSRHEEFETFDTPEHGIRALAVNLLTYYNRYHLGTIRQIITRWAPPSENPTAAYINDVCDRTGFDADASIDLTNEEDLKSLVVAIITQEQGKCPYSDRQIDRGIEMSMGRGL